MIYCQLGIGNTIYKSKPIQISLPELSNDISNYHIYCGYYNSFLYYSPSFSNLEVDLIQLFQRKELCDISFSTINGEKISTHKLILQFRLKENNMIEKLSELISKKTTKEANQVLEMIYSKKKIYSSSKLFKEISEYLKEESLEETMKRMYKSEESKDFIIQRNEKSIKIHKIILSVLLLLHKSVLLELGYKRLQ